MNLKDFNRLNIANLPTKLHLLKNLTKKLDGPNIFIKRDDETGLVFGGNKVRKLEYILAEAIDQGAEVIITSGGAQSNHGRLTVAAAVSFGLKPVLVITDNEPEVYKGNLALDVLLGAELYFVNVENGKDIAVSVQKGEEKVKQLKELYERKGYKTYIIPRGGRSTQGTAAYIAATLEIYQQIINNQLKIDYIVTAVGSGSTIGSLILANKVFKTGIKPIGISVAYSKEECIERILEQTEVDKKYFGFDVEVTKDDIIIFDDYIGSGYALPTEEGIAAIKLLAQTEAIILDQNYTGKAMAGLIDLINKRYFSKNDSVLFLHTGGKPALFSLEDQLYR